MKGCSRHKAALPSPPLQEPGQAHLDGSTWCQGKELNGGSWALRECGARFTAWLGGWAQEEGTVGSAPQDAKLTQHQGLPRARTGVPKGALWESSYQESTEHVEADEVEVGEACAAGVLLPLGKV